MSGPALAYKLVIFSNLMSHDGASDADHNLQVWRPDLTGDWSYLGQSWSNNNTAPTALIVRALEDDALKDITTWECVWDDKGSGKSWNFALWRGVPPSDDYVVLGGVFIRSPRGGGHPAPKGDQANGIKAVRKDLVVKDLTTWVWDDKGTNADKDGSVWRTTGFYGVPPNIIIPSKGHGSASPDISYSLNRTRVVADT